MSETGPERVDPWVETAHALVYKSADQVDCPDCGSHALQVRDVEYGCGCEKGIQRYLICSSCGAFHVVNLRRAGVLTSAR